MNEPTKQADPENIAAGILARGKAQHAASGAKSHICSCSIGFMNPKCEAHGHMAKENWDRATEYTKMAIERSKMGVCELMAHYPAMRECVGLIEGERDALRARVAELEKERDAEKDKRWTLDKANADLHDKIERLEIACADGWKSPDQVARERNALLAERDAAIADSAKLRGLLGEVVISLQVLDEYPNDTLRGIVRGAFIGTAHRITAALATTACPKGEKS